MNGSSERIEINQQHPLRPQALALDGEIARNCRCPAGTLGRKHGNEYFSFRRLLWMIDGDGISRAIFSTVASICSVVKG